jgi:PAS domain S-box-containing protein
MTFQKLTVLILEDTPADAELIADALRGAGIEFDVVQVNQEQELHRLLHEAAPDLIFADHSLVAAHAESALAVSRRLHPTVPFIFISDTPGEEAAVEAVRSGATDYVLKNRIPRLGFVVDRALRERHQARTLPPGGKGTEHALCGFRNRKTGGHRVHELNQLLRAVREINQLIVREREPDKLLAEACNILIRTRGYLHAGIGLVESRSRCVPPVTCSARPAEYLDGFSITWSGDAAEPLPAGTAIHSARSWVCQDIANDARFNLWREPALACGCAALAAIPMIHWGRVTGAITVCSDCAGTFHQEEVRLLEEVAGDLAFALDNIRQEQACRNAETRLRLLDSALQSAANAIVITDCRGGVLWTNPAFTLLTGYTLEEVRGQKPSLLKSGIHDQSFYEGLWKTILAGQVWQSEMVNRRKDGSLFTEECTITPVRGETGAIEHFIAVKQDITARKQAETMLRWRTAFFEALVDSNPDGILVVGNNGKKILQNRRMNELWQIPPQIAADPDDSKQIEFASGRVKNPQQFAEKAAYLYAHTDEVSRDETELTDGTVLDRYSSPVRDQNGFYYGRIWTFRDITAQRQLEARLRQAQKMEAVGQLAGGVAHDFNNILTAIMMNLCILRDTLREPETAEALRELETEAQRAADLTRQLLMFSRKSAIEVKPMDLNRVVEEMLKMLHRLLGENVSIKFRGASALPLVEVDQGMMQQVIMNLSVNSRDAMPGGGQLTIATGVAEIDESSAGTHADRRPGCFVRLSIADTGCGMDEATRKRIFEPFFTTKEISKGTGLGLATVYGIVQLHRGWIEVASEPGKGSVFDVYLPITEKESSGNTNETQLALRGGKETILLVEDEPTVRLVTARGLQMLGYRVIEAADGEIALELWSRHADTIQLLLTDMIMPHGISGLDLAERFQKEKPALKVVIVSGYSAEISAGGIPPQAGILHLPKPFSVPQLATAIRECLDPK